MTVIHTPGTHLIPIDFSKSHLHFGKQKPVTSRPSQKLLYFPQKQKSYNRPHQNLFMDHQAIRRMNQKYRKNTKLQSAFCRDRVDLYTKGLTELFKGSSQQLVNSTKDKFQNIEFFGMPLFKQDSALNSLLNFGRSHSKASLLQMNNIQDGAGNLIRSIAYFLMAKNSIENLKSDWQKASSRQEQGVSALHNGLEAIRGTSLLLAKGFSILGCLFLASENSELGLKIYSSAKMIEIFGFASTFTASMAALSRFQWSQRQMQKSSLTKSTQESLQNFIADFKTQSLENTFIKISEYTSRTLVSCAIYCHAISAEPQNLYANLRNANLQLPDLSFQGHTLSGTTLMHTSAILMTIGPAINFKKSLTVTLANEQSKNTVLEFFKTLQKPFGIYQLWNTQDGLKTLDKIMSLVSSSFCMGGGALSVNPTYSSYGLLFFGIGYSLLIPNLVIRNRISKFES